MSNIKISVVASSVRPELWKDLYESLLENKIEWELILVGNQAPISMPPERLKYICSKTKPAQCYEIGFRIAKGELIHWTADDAIYNYDKPNVLDIMYGFYKKHKTNKLITAFTTKENNGKTFSITSDGHYIGNNTTPRMACFGVISKEFLKELGGYDRRFISGQAENDLCMRALKAGSKIEFCKEAMIAVYHNKAHGEDSKVRKWYPKSREFLEQCWFLAPNEIAEKRILPFEPFEDKNIRKISQEPVGEW